MSTNVKILKVMVCFDDISVLVPCTIEDMTVKQLMVLAACRFKKAIGKPPEYLVNVFNLKSMEGGILDEDDLVFEVIDNKEQIIAVYEEEDKRVRINCGDGRSSIETTSPDLARKQSVRSNYAPNCYEDNSFMIRQTSEPVLSGNDPQMIEDDPNASCSQDDTILSMRKFERSSTRRRCSSNGNSANQQTSSLPPLGFVRNASWRKSTFRGSKKVINWVQNQQQQKRSDPVGSNELNKIEEPLKFSSSFQSKSKLVVLETNKESLGIHVVPEQDSLGRTIGLMVHSVDKDGKIGKIGQIKEKDCIIEINGTSLCDVTFLKAQSLLKEALNSSKLHLRVIPHENRTTSCFQAPIPSTSTPSKDQTLLFTPQKPNLQLRQQCNITSAKPFYTPNVKSNQSQIIAGHTNKPSTCSKIIQPTKTSTSKIINNVTNVQALTPLVEKQVLSRTIKIDLTKGAYGLGFSITTKDNMPPGQTCPIFVKHILSQGAAVDDGRLCPGDKILKVNGMDTGTINQEDVVSYLRGIKLGGKVELVVERQIINTDINNNCDTDVINSSNNNNNFAYVNKIENIHVFVISLVGNIGIGISVRGKTKKEENGDVNDLGLFIKSIHPDGAAARDGRIKEGDKIIEVNGESLAGLSNAVARERLKNAMQYEGPEPDSIQFVLERQVARDSSWTTSTPGPYKMSISGSKQKPPHLMPNEATHPNVLQNVSKNNKTNSSNDTDDAELNATFIELSNNALDRQSTSGRKVVHQESLCIPPNQRKSSVKDLNETQLTLKKALSDESLVSHNTTLMKTPQIDSRTCGIIKDALKKYTSVENMAKFNKPNMATQSNFGSHFKKVSEENNPQQNNICSANKNKFKNIFKNINIFKSKPKKEIIKTNNFQEIEQAKGVTNYTEDKKSIIELLTRKAPTNVAGSGKKDCSTRNLINSNHKNIYPQNVNDYDSLIKLNCPNLSENTRHAYDISNANNFTPHTHISRMPQYDHHRLNNQSNQQNMCNCNECFNHNSYLHHPHPPHHFLPSTPQLRGTNRSRNHSQMLNRNSQTYDCCHNNYFVEEEPLYYHQQQHQEQPPYHHQHHLNKMNLLYHNHQPLNYNHSNNIYPYFNDFNDNLVHDYDDPFNETSTTLHHF